MKSFRLYKPSPDFKKINEFKPSKVLRIFKVVKRSIFSTIIIALIAGLIAGAFSSIYLAPWLKDKLNLDSDSGDSQQDLFLEKYPSLLPEAENNHRSENESQVQSIPDIVENVSPAVVSVIVSKYVPVLEKYYYNPFEEFEQYFGEDFGMEIPQYRQKGEELQEVGGGTGFIVSSDGLVVTNRHVVADKDAEYTVMTNDGKKYSAPVLARDPVQDIAVLKISADNLPTLKLGDSDKIRIGQTVIAIGNALGEFRNTVSVGVVSGLARSVSAASGGSIEHLEEVIQTDAAINLGNSGGPLLNLYGQVIGMNTAMAVGAENIGFAIPVNKVKKVVTDIQEKGKISYPFLGVRYILINESIAEKNNLPVDYGALVARGDSPGEVAVMPGSGADRAGIVENDIILEADGKKITSENTLSKAILKHDVGDKVILKILHRGEEKIIEAELDEWNQQ